MKTNRAKNQRGLTIVEVLIALVVAGGIIAVVLAGYSRVRTQGQAQGYLQTLEAIVAAVEARFPRNNYTGLTPASVIASPTFPRTMVSADGLNVIGPEGGRVDITAGAVGDWGQEADTAFSLGFADVSPQVCETTVRLMAPRAARIAVGSAVVMSRATNAGAIDTNALRTQCANERNTVSVRIEP